MLVVVAYDITDEARRRRVARELAGWGFRVQKSVFEVWLSPGELPKLLRAIERLVEPEDSVIVYPIGRRERERRVSLGSARLTEPPDIWIL